MSSTIERKALGVFTCTKHCKDGRQRTTRAGVFPLAVIETAPSRPEQHEREKRWFAVDEAANAVAEEGLSQLIRSLRARL